MEAMQERIQERIGPTQERMEMRMEELRGIAGRENDLIHGTTLRAVMLR